MKTKIDAYTFSAANKTIAFAGIDVLDLSSVLVISNVTDGTLIYNFADPTKTGTASGHTLTLAFDTSGMADSDDLLIYLDLPEAPTVASAANDDPDWGAIAPLSQLPAQGGETVGLNEQLTYDTNAARVWGSNPRPDPAAIHSGDIDDPLVGPTKVGGVASNVPPTAVNQGAKVVAWFDPVGDQMVSMGTALSSAYDSVAADGTIAHDSVDAGYPVKVGGRAQPLNPSPVSATQDRIDAAFTTTGQLQTLDAGGNTAAALTLIEPWNPNGTYNAGDLVNYYGVIYQCIGIGSAASPTPGPNNATYWQRALHQSQGLVGTAGPLAPTAGRMHVEADFAAYERNIRELEILEDTPDPTLTNAMVQFDTVFGSQSLTSPRHAMYTEAVGYGGTFRATVVVVGTTSLPLPSIPLSLRRSMAIQSDSANTASIYLGGPGVTADATVTGGFVLNPGESIPTDVGSALIYAIAGAAAQNVRVLEVS